MSMTYEEEQFLLERNQVSMFDQGNHQPDFLTVAQYAALNGVHKHTVLNWIKAGKVPFVPRSHGIYVRYYIPADTVPPIIRPDRCA
ncbi:MAG: helix-turn-helix domain-containing protein [Clostridia bacterium]|nr:helix-turn-helix domain-containing protein [Clostridia bacterium]